MRFSVITPVNASGEFTQWRIETLHRAVRSVQAQSFEDWEHIIIDDGSPTAIEGKWPKTKIIRQEHLERIIAYNKGFKEAKGEWICLLDSDDEYISYYLEACDAMIKKYPKQSVFNFGSIHIYMNYRGMMRDPFEPKKEKVGHEVFGPGRIVNGTFIFKRKCLDKVGMFPEKWNPWDFSTHAQKEFPEIKPLFTVKLPDHPKGYPRELGNPWGNDFYLFYKLTRKYHSMPIKAHLYIVHPSRKDHKLD